VEQLDDIEPKFAAFDFAKPRTTAPYDIRGVCLAPSMTATGTAYFVQQHPVPARA